MLSKRYADPFPVLNEMISNEMLPEFIENLIDQDNEDKLWQLYLAVALMEDRSFSAWKADVLQSSPVEDNRNMTDIRQELTPEEAVVQAEGILSGFNPF